MPQITSSDIVNNLGKSLQDSLAEMIRNTTAPFIVTDPKKPDNPIIMCNKPFIELTGYDESEILGQNCRFLSGKDTNPKHSQLIAHALRNNQPIQVRILNYKKDGTPFQNALLIVPIFNEIGEVDYFLGSQFEQIKAETTSIISQQIDRESLINTLSPQQKRVLAKVAAGYKNKQIAHSFQISESTIKKHRAEIMKKLNVTSTAEIIRVAVQAGL